MRVSEVYKQINNWMLGGFAAMVITGALLFWARAASSYANPYFLIKMTAIVLAGANAMVFQYPDQARDRGVGYCGQASDERPNGGPDVDRPLGRGHCGRPDDGVYVLAERTWLPCCYRYLNGRR